MARFYRDAVGFVPIGEESDPASFDLGDNIILELVPGGKAVVPPDDRKATDALIIMRVDEIDHYRRHLESHGVKIINQKIEVYWGEVSYFVDPEGQVLGVENARHPGTYAPEKATLTEGLEAERRWRELKGRDARA